MPEAHPGFVGGRVMSSQILGGFFEFARRFPEATALFYGESMWSYGWLAQAALEAQDALEHAGAFCSASQPVPRIGLYCPNGVDHVLWALAIIAGGACLVPIPQELTVAERESLVRQTGLNAVVVAGGVQWNFESISQTEVHAAGLSGRISLLEGWAVLEFSEKQFSALRPALIRFSSGTTGVRKGVVLSHGSLLERILSANRRLRINDLDRVLWTLPMAHHFAVSILLYLNAGAGVILAEAHLADELLSAALRFEATIMYGSPFHYRLLSGECSARGWPSLRLAVSTAAALSVEVAARFYQRFGVRLVQGLGIIEAGLPLLNSLHAAEYPTAVGIADDFEVNIMGGDGTSAQEGELCLRGPGMFDAYLIPWTLCEDVMRDGWFHSGDIARVHANGNIELIGRSKSVLNIGGMKCFPEEIEAVLATFPGVSEVRVRGEEHPRWGVLPVADVVPSITTDPPKASEMAAHCRKVLAPYKVPVRFLYVERLEKTATGKLRRI